MNLKKLLGLCFLIVVLGLQFTCMDIIDPYYWKDLKHRMIEDVSIIPSFVSETLVLPNYSCYITADSKTSEYKRLKVKSFKFKKNGKTILEDNDYNQEQKLIEVPYEKTQKLYSGYVNIFKNFKPLLLRTDKLELIINVEILKESGTYTKEFTIPLKVVFVRFGIV